MITALKINRFRSIQSAAIDDLGPVNIFIGRNGVGKSSVLESVLLLSNPIYPGNVAHLAQWREMAAPSQQNDYALYSIFFNNNISSGPRLEFTVNNQNQSLDITPLTDTSGMNVSVETSKVPDEQHIDDTQPLLGLQYLFTGAEVGMLRSRLILTPQGSQGNWDRPYKGLGAFFIHARRATSTKETANLLTTLSQKRTDSDFVEAIKSFSPQVKDMEGGFVGNEPVVLVDTGLPTKLPLNVMGDGFCRMSLMMTGLFYHPRLLIVDEIDSGLHKSAMIPFWRSLCERIAQSGKQIFCTTHSEEMLMSTLEAFRDKQNMLRIFRIDRTPSRDVVVTKYTYEKFRHAYIAEADIR